MQQVNLYIEELRPKREWLTLNNLCFAALALLVLLSGVSVWLSAGQSNLQADLAQKQTQLDGLHQTVSELAARAEQQKQDESLVRANERLKAKVEARENMLGLLGSVSLSGTEGFSNYLIGLARHKQKDVWLSQISISGAGKSMLMAGTTKDASRIPEYLGALTQESSFLGRSFEVFDVSTQEKDDALMDFRLESKASQEQTLVRARSEEVRIEREPLKVIRELENES